MYTRTAIEASANGQFRIPRAARAIWAGRAQPCAVHRPKDMSPPTTASSAPATATAIPPPPGSDCASTIPSTAWNGMLSTHNTERTEMVRGRAGGRSDRRTRRGGGRDRPAAGRGTGRGRQLRRRQASRPVLGQGFQRRERRRADVRRHGPALGAEGVHLQRALLRGGHHRHLDVADPEDVAGHEGRALGAAAVHEDAVGRAAVAEDEAVGAGLDHRVPPRALRVVDDEVARRVAADDGDPALQGHAVHRAARVADLEFHRETGSRWRKVTGF